MDRPASAMQVLVVVAHAEEIPADALVVPTNSTGEMSGGFAAIVRERGGIAIQQQAMRFAPIAVGAALVTDAGALRARHVIHVPVAEEPALKTTIEGVRRATRAALLAAAARSLPIVAMPFMCRPPTELSNAEVARAMADELRAHKQANPQAVYLADPCQDVTAAYEEMLRAVQ